MEMVGLVRNLVTILTTNCGNLPSDVKRIVRGVLMTLPERMVCVVNFVMSLMQNLSTTNGHGEETRVLILAEESGRMIQVLTNIFRQTMDTCDNFMQTLGFPRLPHLQTTIDCSFLSHPVPQLTPISSGMKMGDDVDAGFQSAAVLASSDSMEHDKNEDVRQWPISDHCETSGK